MFTRPVGSDTALQRPRPKGLVGGALLTALIAAWIKVSRGRLAPNFYEGCRPLVSRAHQDKPDWQTSYECRYPDRLREIRYTVKGVDLSYFLDGRRGGGVHLCIISYTVERYASMEVYDGTPTYYVGIKKCLKGSESVLCLAGHESKVMK